MEMTGSSDSGRKQKSVIRGMMLFERLLCADKRPSK
jgi:hypothetical protein